MLQMQIAKPASFEYRNGKHNFCEDVEQQRSCCHTVLNLQDQVVDFLDQINWGGDDGVFFPMINDWRRNQYFEAVIADSVQDQNCIDVGFGTGLLSLLALKHGAKHVEAYEQDHNRYQLGQYIIKKLGLNAQIELKHQRFDCTVDIDPNSVVISETVNTQLWGEGLWRSIPLQGNIKWAPDSVFMHVIAEPIPRAFAQDLFRSAQHFEFFNPGVDISQDFVDLINHLSTKNQPVRDTIATTDGNQTTVWGGWTHLKWAQIGHRPRAAYTVNIGNRSWSKTDGAGHSAGFVNHTDTSISLQIELPYNLGLPVLIQPRVGLQHQGRHGCHTLFLDTAECWGGGCSPLIVTEPAAAVTITHSVQDGLITYQVQ